jgi:uncharacterized protein YndB with AHSA1/START domain
MKNLWNMKTLEVNLERVIDATPAEVFDAWLDPEHPGSPWYAVDRLILHPVVDGLFYRMHVAKQGAVAGQMELPHFGRFIAIEPGRRIQHTWMSQHTRGVETLVTVDFRAEGDRTRLVLRHIGIPDDEFGRMHEVGWTHYLKALTAYFDSFSGSFTVPQSPEEAMAAIADVRGWWSEGITGSAARVGDRFVHTYQDIHRCEIEVTTIVPGRQVVWTVVGNHFNFTKDKTEWIGTQIVFDLTAQDGETEVILTHVGLVPAYECYDICRDGWTTYLASLERLIRTGKGEPNVGEARTESERMLSEKV